MARQQVSEKQLMIARVLYRADKWDPARDQTAPFAWEDHREGYIDKAKRLQRMLEKDGFDLVRDSEMA